MNDNQDLRYFPVLNNGNLVTLNFCCFESLFKVKLHLVKFFRMYFKTVFVFLILIMWGCSSGKKIMQSPKILVFAATKGFRHKSVTDGKTALLKMGLEKNWSLDTTEDATLFTHTNLKQYGVVVFLNTTGNILNDEQQTAFEKYIQAGGGFVGIHAAADTEYEWPWYNGLAGAYFESHPKPQTALYTVVNKKHPSVNFMPDTLRRPEEIYNFKSFKNELVNVLITVDEKSYTGGKWAITIPFHGIIITMVAGLFIQSGAITLKLLPSDYFLIILQAPSNGQWENDNFI